MQPTALGACAGPPATAHCPAAPATAQPAIERARLGKTAAPSSTRHSAGTGPAPAPPPATAAAQSPIRNHHFSHHLPDQSVESTVCFGIRLTIIPRQSSAFRKTDLREKPKSPLCTPLSPPVHHQDSRNPPREAPAPGTGCSRSGGGMGMGGTGTPEGPNQEARNTEPTLTVGFRLLPVCCAPSDDAGALACACACACLGGVGGGGETV